METAAIGAAISGAKALLDLLNNAKDAYLADTIAQHVWQLQSELIVVQNQMLMHQAELDLLRTENRRFKTYVFHHSVSWRTPPGGPIDGPLCPVCFSEGKDVALMLRPVVDQTSDVWHVQCPFSHVSAGRGREPHYAIPKKLVAECRF